jgi:hypothetical protein
MEALRDEMGKVGSHTHMGDNEIGKVGSHMGDNERYKVVSHLGGCGNENDVLRLVLPHHFFTKLPY